MPAEPRLATGVWVSALLRRANAAGEFSAVLRKGDATAGAVILVARSRDGAVQAFARVSTLARPRWERAAAESDAVDRYVEKQTRYDEDLWVVELLTEDISQLVDETIVSD